MFRINQLVVFSGYVCQVRDINKQVYHLLHIDGSEVKAIENDIYPYLGKLCATTFNKERRKNKRKNLIAMSILFSIFLAMTGFVNLVYGAI